MSVWDWVTLLGALASIAGLVLYFTGAFSAPQHEHPPPKERIEPTHSAPERTQPRAEPSGHQIDATNVKDSEITGGSHGSQPRNSRPNKIRVTNAEGSRIVGGNDKP